MNIIKRTFLFLGFIVSVLIGQSCDKNSTTDIVSHDTTPYTLEIGDFPPPQIAADNMLTEQGVKLGRMLFYEKKLSRDGSMSCGTCHRQKHAFADTNQFSIGVDGFPGGRQAMAVFNMAWNTNEFFWDGRAHLLRDQSLLPIQDSLEMAETLPNAIAKLENEQMYKDQFMRAFGSEEITSEKMSLALEQFMNSIVSVESKYDKFLRGEATFTASENRGRKLFFQEYNEFFPDSSGADCAHCHSPKNFENDRYMNNGLETDASVTDFGRENVTNQASDRGKMKVTSLRNIELTAPYMHDGRFTTLQAVVNHYNVNIKKSSTLDPALDNTTNTGLRLTPQDRNDLIAFLKTLTDLEMMTEEEYSDPFE